MATAQSLSTTVLVRTTYEMTLGFKPFTVITRVLFSSDGRATKADPPVIENIRNGRAKNQGSWLMGTGQGKLVIQIFLQNETNSLIDIV